MKKLTCNILLLLILAACTSKNKPYAVDSEDAMAEEESNEWTILFDGSNLDQWRGFKKDYVPGIWSIEEGQLTCLDRGSRGDSIEGGDIMTRDQFENFELSLEWKISPGGNSGIIYFIQETDSSIYPWNTGPEMQVLDNESAGDNLEKHMAGDLYDMISCSEITVNPAGEWNSVRIVADGSRVEHWLNEVKVVEYDLNSAELDSLIQNSKWRNYPEFGMSTSGHISLQDHGNRVWYRNIKIRNLEP